MNPGDKILDIHGHFRRLGAYIGRGGEGTVFALQHQPDILIKCYHAGRRALPAYSKEQRAKITQQISMSAALRSLPLAWPRVLIFDELQNWLGYAMYHARGFPLAKLIHPNLYHQHAPALNRIELVGYLLNLLATLDALHQQNIFVGDLNPHNLLCDPHTGTVTLLDCDSFQIPHSDEQVFACTVGHPSLLPPEFRGKSLKETRRNAASDCYAVAMITFMTLMMGRHPFDHQGGESLADNMTKGFFPYARCNISADGQHHIPLGEWYLLWQMIPDTLQQLFERCFIEGLHQPEKRPTLAEFRQHLQHYHGQLVNGEKAPCLGIPRRMALEAPSSSESKPIMLRRATPERDVVSRVVESIVI